MATITAYNELGFGLDLVSADSDIAPSTNITDEYFEEYGGNRIRVFQEYDDGDYLVTSKFMLLSETKFILTSMLVEDALSQNLVKVAGIDLKFDVNDDLDAINFDNALLGGSDTIFGNDFADLLNSRGGNDRLYGNGGRDILKGGSGKDRLYGGKDEDILNGGKDNDKLFGQEGNDILKGGGGADKFVFRTGYEQDTIKDFNDKDDVLDLRSFDLSSVSEAKSYASMVDGDTVFDFGAGDLLTLEDFNLSALDKGDFII